MRLELELQHDSVKMLKPWLAERVLETTEPGTGGTIDITACASGIPSFVVPARRGRPYDPIFLQTGLHSRCGRLLWLFADGSWMLLFGSKCVCSGSAWQIAAMLPYFVRYRALVQAVMGDKQGAFPKGAGTPLLSRCHGMPYTVHCGDSRDSSVKHVSIQWANSKDEAAGQCKVGIQATFGEIEAHFSVFEVLGGEDGDPA